MSKMFQALPVILLIILASIVNYSSHTTIETSNEPTLRDIISQAKWLRVGLILNYTYNVSMRFSPQIYVIALFNETFNVTAISDTAIQVFASYSGIAFFRTRNDEGWNDSSPWLINGSSCTNLTIEVLLRPTAISFITTPDIIKNKKDWTYEENYTTYDDNLQKTLLHIYTTNYSVIHYDLIDYVEENVTWFHLNISAKVERDTYINDTMELIEIEKRNDTVIISGYFYNNEELYGLIKNASIIRYQGTPIIYSRSSGYRAMDIQGASSIKPSNSSIKLNSYYIPPEQPPSGDNETQPIENETSQENHTAPQPFQLPVSILLYVGITIGFIVIVGVVIYYIKKK